MSRLLSFRPVCPALAVFALALMARGATPAKSLSDWPANAEPAAVGRHLAENFLARPFIFASTPKKPFVRYQEVCSWYGALSVAELTRDVPLQRRLAAHYDSFRTPEGAAHLSPEAHVDFRVFGVVPLELYRQTHDPVYLETGLNFADRQWARTTPDGITAEARYWVDDMYMITSLQVQAFRATRERKYLDRAALAMTAYLDRLQQPNGLFFHATDSPFYWARGNGWFAAGLTELLRSLPADHPRHARILRGYRTMMASLLQYQTPDGRWRQLIDRPDFWPETSGTGMFAFALIVGVKQGWLDAADYAPAARRAWLALVASLDPDGNARDVCVGTNTSAMAVGPDRPAALQYYRDRPRRTGDLHAQAAILWSAAALLRD